MVRMKYVALLGLMMMLSLCLTACFGTPEEPHTHNWSDWYDSYDGIHHYKVCDGCDEIIEEEIPEEPEQPFTYTVGEDDTCIITEATLAKGKVDVPAEIDGYTVVGIGYGAFANDTTLTEVTLPDTLLYIEEEAFYGCANLTSVVVPNSVERIEFRAFGDCVGLESITLPLAGRALEDEDEEYHFGYIFGAFGSPNHSEYVPDSLTTVVLTECTRIERYAFRDCTSISSITIPDTVEHIGEGAFEECTSLTAVHISDLEAWCRITFESETANPLCFGKRLYKNDREVSSVTFPKDMNEVGDYVFYHCVSLKAVTIPDSVTRIGRAVFRGCEALETITIPFVGAVDGDISNGNFGYLFDCGITAHKNYVPSTLETVTVTGGTTIGMRAFENCTSIKRITIPASVTSIGSGAFGDCTSLGAVYISDLRAWCETSFASETANPLYYAGKLYLKGEEAQNLTISDDTEKVCKYAFYGCTGLSSVSIPKSVKSIEDAAFYGCTCLSVVNMEEELESIGKEAFLGCERLQSVTIPKSVTAIGASAFKGCTSIKTMTIPFVGNTKDGVNNTYFGYIFGAGFASNQGGRIPASLTSVTITGGSVLSDSAFNGCTTLTEIILPNDLTEIGSSAFKGCTSIKTMTIPGSVSTIGDYAFSGCTALTEVTMQDGVVTIDGYAFHGCTSLNSVTIPQSVNSIGRRAFYGCTSLSAINISTTGWYYVYESSTTEGTNVDMSDPAVAADYLTETHWNYIFKR